MQTIHTISDGNLLASCYNNIWAGRVFNLFAGMVDGNGGREGAVSGIKLSTRLDQML